MGYNEAINYLVGFRYSIRLIGQNVLIKTAVPLVNTGAQRFNLF